MDKRSYEVVSISLTKEDADYLSKEAKRLGISKSEYIKNMMEVIKLLKGRFMIIEK